VGVGERAGGVLPYVRVVARRGTVADRTRYAVRTVAGCCSSPAVVRRRRCTITVACSRALARSLSPRSSEVSRMGERTFANVSSCVRAPSLAAIAVLNTGPYFPRWLWKRRPRRQESPCACRATVALPGRSHLTPSTWFCVAAASGVRERG